jgi:hypothetical protein
MFLLKQDAVWEVWCGGCGLSGYGVDEERALRSQRAAVRHDRIEKQR